MIFILYIKKRRVLLYQILFYIFKGYYLFFVIFFRNGMLNYKIFVILIVDFFFQEFEKIIVELNEIWEEKLRKIEVIRMERLGG